MVMNLAQRETDWALIFLNFEPRFVSWSFVIIHPLQGFYEEELDVQLVLFDQMLDHVLRIDRIYRQPQVR